MSIISTDTCIIVANGPSLNDVPLPFLSMYPTWGVNKIFLKEDFKPTYYVTVHGEMAPFAEQINALGAQMFVKDKVADLFPGCRPLHSVKRARFYQKPTGDAWDVWEGWSVIFVCLQIAYWLGYKTALLVGLDHDYTYGSFHPDYYKDTPTEPHEQDKLLPAFKMARYEYARDGRHIINLTPNTKEPVFEKGLLQEWYP
jgi:hypothetical protein